MENVHVDIDSHSRWPWNVKKNHSNVISVGLLKLVENEVLHYIQDLSCQKPKRCWSFILVLPHDLETWNINYIASNVFKRIISLYHAPIIS